MLTISKELMNPNYDDLGEPQSLQPIISENIEDWYRERQRLKNLWEEFLGKPSCQRPDGKGEVIDDFELPYCNITVFRQPTGPKTRQLVVLMEPKGKVYSPRPGAVVPYYHPDLMAGYDFSERKFITERPEAHFGRHLVQLGYVVVCVEAFPFNTVAEPEKYKGFGVWQAGAEKVLADNPDWTGMGKLIWDTQLATDILINQPDINKERIAIIGHSLGGKMAFYTGILDERIKAIIASDFGIGYDFTNWDDLWYLGKKIYDSSLQLAHHQLLALHAPRSFLLVAGEFDKRESWQYINEARKVYKLYGKEEAIGMLHHGKGHKAPADAMLTTYKWLAEQFSLCKEGISEDIINVVY